MILGSWVRAPPAPPRISVASVDDGQIDIRCSQGHPADPNLDGPWGPSVARRVARAKPSAGRFAELPDRVDMRWRPPELTRYLRRHLLVQCQGSGERSAEL